MKPERKIINDKLWEFANRLDKLNTDIRMYDILLEDLGNPLKATSYDKESGNGENSSTVESAVILRERYCKSIEDCTRAKEKCMREFEEYISPLKFHCRQILRAKYIEGSNNLQLARKFNYTKDGINYVLRTALDTLYIKSF